MPGILLIVAAVAFPMGPAAGGDVSQYRLVTPKDDGIMATGLNGRGDLVGFAWAEEKNRPGVVSQVPFYLRGKTLIPRPVLVGYTATHPAALSDTGFVVGRVSKPTSAGRSVHLRNQAFLWDDAKGIRGLGALADDSASFACGISRDGSIISGVSVGINRVRACVWERDGDEWKGAPLPQAGRLGSQVVVISADGRRIASIDGEGPCLWSRATAKGPWARQVMAAPDAIAPRAVNDAGTIVGLSYRRDGLTEATIWTPGNGIIRPEMPKGYIRAEAAAINNAGVVVGMMDGRADSGFGPKAFVYENGKVRVLDECGPALTSATAINDAGQVAGVLDKEDAAEADRHRPNRRPRN